MPGSESVTQYCRSDSPRRSRKSEEMALAEIGNEFAVADPPEIPWVSRDDKCADRKHAALFNLMLDGNGGPLRPKWQRHVRPGNRCPGYDQHQIAGCDKTGHPVGALLAAEMTPQQGNECQFAVSAKPAKRFGPRDLGPKHSRRAQCDQ